MARETTADVPAKDRTVINVSMNVHRPFSLWCEDAGLVMGVAAERLLVWYMAQPEDERRRIHAEGGKLVSDLRTPTRRESMAARLPAENASDAIVSGGKLRVTRKVRSS